MTNTSISPIATEWIKKAETLHLYVIGHEESNKEKYAIFDRYVKDINEPIGFLFDAQSIRELVVFIKGYNARDWKI